MGDSNLGLIIVLTFFVLIEGLLNIAGQGDVVDVVDKPQEAMEENYTFYLDGKEIDPTKYNFDGYRLNYNQEDKVVTMTKKSLVF